MPSGSRSSLLGGVVSTAILLVGTPEASADVVDVFPGGSVQTAIDGAADGDVILVYPGTYAESLDFLGKAITVRGVGADPEDVIIDAGGLGRTVSFLNGEGADSVLERLTLTGGADSLGAGLVIAQSTPTIRDCVIANNGSSETSQGGGAAFISQASGLVIRDCTFVGNEAFNGGAVWTDLTSVTFVHCTFEANTGIAQAAALGLGNNPDFASTLIGCRFVDNVAGNGIGLIRSCGPLTMVNCLVAGNTADGTSSMIRNECGPDTEMWGCTIVDNTVGGGPAVWSGSPGADAVFRNCIVRGNGPATFGDGAAVSWSNVQGGFDGAGNFDADPMFRDPAAGDFRLLPGSPCIDRGDATNPPADAADVDADGDTSEPIPLDLAGNPRQVDDPGASNNGIGSPPLDVGAYERPVAACPGDLDENGTVEFDDLLALLSSWGADTWPQDIDQSGAVDFGDLLILLSHWGTCG